MIRTPAFPDFAIPGLQRPVVLVVEDEPGIREAVRATLERLVEAVDILEAESGEDALRILMNRRVDVIVADHQMPGMTGIDLLRKVRETAPGTRRVLMTAYGESRVPMATMVGAGIHAFLPKPFGLQDMADVVRRELREANSR